MSLDGILLSNQHLILVEHDVCDIAKRIRKIEEGYFIVRNVLRDRLEVHSTANVGDTYCFTVPYDELDARTLDYCRQTNNALHGEVYKEMKSHNQKIIDGNKREFEMCMREISQETRKDVSFAMDKDNLYEGYRKSVTV